MTDGFVGNIYGLLTTSVFLEKIGNYNFFLNVPCHTVIMMHGVNFAILYIASLALLSNFSQFSYIECKHAQYSSKMYWFDNLQTEIDLQYIIFHLSILTCTREGWWFVARDFLWFYLNMLFWMPLLTQTKLLHKGVSAWNESRST